MSKPTSIYRDLARTWIKLLEVMVANSIFREGSLHLSEYAFGQFDPKVVIERLLDPKPGYFAYKDILFAGLCAWTASPFRSDLVEEAMVLAGISKMAKLETANQLKIPQDPLLADFVARLTGTGIDFYRDFYYPMGGLDRVLRARSPDLLREALREASEDIGFLIEIVRISHYHADKLQNRKKFRTSSVTCSSRAVAILLNDPKLAILTNSILRKSRSARSINGLNCTKKAAPFQVSAALSYAAYSLLHNGNNFLSIICNGEASFAQHGYLLTEWIGRSAFVAEHVISNMFTRTSKDQQTAFLTNVTPIEMSSPEFENGSIKIENAFDITIVPRQ